MKRLRRGEYTALEVLLFVTLVVSVLLPHNVWFGLGLLVWNGFWMLFVLRRRRSRAATTTARGALEEAIDVLDIAMQEIVRRQGNRQGDVWRHLDTAAQALHQTYRQIDGVKDEGR